MDLSGSTTRKLLMLRKFISKWVTNNTKEETSSINDVVNDNSVLVAASAKDIYEAAPRLLQLRNMIIEERALDREYAEKFYGELIDNFIEFIQAFPASQSEHHSMHYGLALHSLEVALYATRRERGQVFIPGTEDRVPLLRDRFTFGVFISALLHDVAKVLCDIQVVYFNSSNQPIVWNPLIENIPSGARYKYIYRQNRNYSLHAGLNCVFLTRVLSNEQINWLHSSYDVWSIVFGYLSANYENSQLITQIVKHCDAHSAKSSVGNKLHTNQQAEATKIDKAISDIRRVVFASNKINHMGQPIFVLSTHILLLHPAWCDALTDDQSERKRLQTRILNVLGESNYIIKSDTRTLNNVQVEQQSTKFGNINKTFWNVILIQRSIIDPDNRLKTGDLVIRPTPQSPLDGYGVESKPDTDPQVVVNEQNDNKSSECDEGISNSIQNQAPTNTSSNEESSCITTEHYSTHVNEKHEKKLLNDYVNDGKQNNASISDASQNDSNEKENMQHNSQENVLASSQLHRTSFDLQKNNTKNNNAYTKEHDDREQHVEQNVMLIDNKISKLFIAFLTVCLADSKLNSVAQAPVHKHEKHLYCVWPKTITLFMHRYNRELKQEFGNVNESVIRRMVLELNYHDKQKQNLDFVSIKFKVGNSGRGGMSISAIKICSSICQQIQGFDVARTSRNLLEEKS